MPLPAGTIVFCLLHPDGERFAILRPDEIAAGAARWMAAADRRAGFEKMIESITWLSEAEVRTGLAALGSTAEDVDARIVESRQRAAVMLSGPTVFERITEPGYRNPEGQEVVRKTDQSGRDGQRVFVMRCTVCGHQYGAYGIDADIRRCPACQDGPPGVL